MHKCLEQLPDKAECNRPNHLLAVRPIFLGEPSEIVQQCATGEIDFDPHIAQARVDGDYEIERYACETQRSDHS